MPIVEKSPKSPDGINGALGALNFICVQYGFKGDATQSFQFHEVFV